MFKEAVTNAPGLRIGDSAQRSLRKTTGILQETTEKRKESRYSKV
jgi:hypothetical protein